MLLCLIAHAATCVKGDIQLKNALLLFTMNSYSSFRLHKGLLQYQGAQDFDDHFKDILGISPLNWDLKLQIASDLAKAMQQCHVR